MKIKLLLYTLLLLHISCEDNNISNEKILLKIGEIKLGQAIINVDSISNVADIESILFNEDTCCNYSEKFTLQYENEDEQLRVNARVYRDCDDHLISVGEQRYQSSQVFKIRNNDILYTGKIYNNENIDKIFNVFFKEKRFDDNICVVFLNKKEKNANVKKFISLLSDGYFKFISKNKIYDRAEYNFELIFLLDSYALEYDKTPFLLHNEERRLRNEPTI